MTGPDCAVMCKLLKPIIKNTHTHIHTLSVSLVSTNCSANNNSECAKIEAHKNLSRVIIKRHHPFLQLFSGLLALRRRA